MNYILYNEMNFPVDQVHFDSMQATARIREIVDVYRQKIANWEPTPMPHNYGR